MKKHIFFISILSIFTVLFSNCKKKSAEKYFENMNTFMKVKCYGKNSEEAVIAAQKYIKELEETISVTKEDSEIYKLNQAQNFPVIVSEKVSNLIKYSILMAKKTDGAFNPCLYPITSAWGFTKKENKIPSDEELKKMLPLADYKKVRINGNAVSMEKGMMIDLGAVGKGFAGDEAAKIMKSFGIKSALLDLGGNIQTIGSKPDGSNWTIGIKNPFEQGNIGSIEVKDKAVITSGGYERFFIGKDGKKYIHIFDGKTGKPAETEIVSSTVIGKSGTECDALSTSLFVMGIEKSINFWKNESNFDFILVTDERKIYVSEGIFDNFSFNNSIPDAQAVEIICIKKDQSY